MLNILAFRRLGRMLSKTGSGYKVRFRALFSGLGSMHTRILPFAFLATTRLETHSVGLSSRTMTPRCSNRLSSFSRSSLTASGTLRSGNLTGGTSSSICKCVLPGKVPSPSSNNTWNFLITSSFVRGIVIVWPICWISSPSSICWCGITTKVMAKLVGAPRSGITRSDLTTRNSAWHSFVVNGLLTFALKAPSGRIVVLSYRLRVFLVGFRSVCGGRSCSPTALQAAPVSIWNRLRWLLTSRSAKTFFCPLRMLCAHAMLTSLLFVIPASLFSSWVAGMNCQLSLPSGSLSCCSKLARFSCSRWYPAPAVYLHP